ncbi:lactonase family protein [Ideonella livida]|uniref:Lactonase family protein n=1 Tax=Ideonella livida TaxID=2707176 RepID=A0A7C9PIZ9_9BURK|nr:lactonase family protein [Ideonella livida]NDY93215.1 lactonase family protein [Ideonella livida]
MNLLTAYLGTRTTRERNARGEGLSVLRFDPATGALQRVQLLADLVNPSYLAVNRAGSRLYCVHGDGFSASAFAIAADGTLSPLNTVDTRGRNPVHLALSPDEGHLLVCNHLGASLVLLPVQADGRLGDVVQQVDFGAGEGRPFGGRLGGPIPGQLGPHRVEQPQAKPHQCPFTPDGRHVLVPDKGLDRIVSLPWDGQRLRPEAATAVAAREGAGPRHAVGHPQQPWVYTVNELDSTVLLCTQAPDTGTLSPRQVVSTLPDTFCGHSRAAAIALDAAGRLLYASNRGHDSVAVFAVDPDTGRLSLRQVQATGGRTPRAFTLSPCGRWLLALNEDSDTVTTFTVHPDDGTLQPTGAVLHAGSPVCLVFRP